ncbi:MAG: phosphatase PAP2 family protein [Ignavibacteria bacterium]|nr:phosphatase PAP2 family protein [Ignavibacteria bacterium]
MIRLPRYLVLVWLAAIAVSILWLDQPLALWIESTQTHYSRMLGHWLEEAGKAHWILGYCVIITVIAWRSRRDEAYDHLRLFGAVAASGIIANIMKVLACRPRPPLLIEKSITEWNLLGLQMEYIWNSFPSGHATTGLAIAVAGSAVYPRLKHAFWIIGLAIAVGRIMLNAHYLSDVLAGSLIGVVVSIWFASRLRSKPLA